MDMRPHVGVLCLAVSVVLGTLAIKIFLQKLTRDSFVPAKKKVNLVSGCLPIVGHAYAFGKDPLTFMNNCAKKHGKVFRIKLFRSEYVIVCDRDLGPEFLKATEASMSLYDVLKSLFLNEVYAESLVQPDLINTLLRKSIAMNYDVVVPKIRTEAEEMITRLRVTCEESPLPVDLHKVMFKFVTNTSARCLLGIALPDSGSDDFKKFASLVDKAILASFLLPRWVVRLFFRPLLAKLQRNIGFYFEQEILKYREDHTKRDSLFIRTAVDYINPTNGENLSNEIIRGLMLAVLYGSVENTALELTNTLKELAGSPKYWNGLKVECKQNLAKNDLRAIIESPLMAAVVMESARRNSNILPILRKPTSRTATLGDYYVGDADVVAMCTPMLMLTGYASEIFRDPETYNPGRFLKRIGNETRVESFSPQSVLTWSAGLHGCPGKTFALCEMKITIALILQHFRIELKTDKMSRINYASTAALAVREAEVIFKLI